MTSCAKEDQDQYSDAHRIQVGRLPVTELNQVIAIIINQLLLLPRQFNTSVHCKEPDMKLRIRLYSSVLQHRCTKII